MKPSSFIKDVVGIIVGNIKWLGKKAMKCGPLALLVLNPFAIIFVLYVRQGAFSMGLGIAIATILIVVAYILSVISRAAKNTYDGIPIHKRRFTKKDEEGDVLFETKYIVDMVAYLAEVEDYFEKHGKYKGL